MAIEIINVGTSPNDGNGDPIRDAFIKCNDNFDELETTKISGSGTDDYIPKFNGSDGIENSQIFDNGTNVGIGTTSPITGNLVIAPTTASANVEGISVLFHPDGNITRERIKIWINNFNGQLDLKDSGEVKKVQINSNGNSYLNGGNVGIGTTSPNGIWSGTNRSLQISGSTNTSSELVQTRPGANITRFLSGTNDEFGVYTDSALNYTLYTNGAERFRITSSGQVQISSPISDALKLTNSNSGAYNGVLIQNDASNQVVIGIGGSSVGGSNQNRGYSGTISNIDYYLMTNNTERMRIDSSGNVIIGATSGPHKFSVNGKIGGNIFSDSFLEFTSGGNTLLKANDDVIIGYSQNTIIKQNGNFGIGTTSPSNYSGYTTLTLNNATSGGLIDLQNNGTSALRISADSSTQVSIYGATAVPMIFTTNASERMRITSSGNVGIGTTNPLKALHISRPAVSAPVLRLQTTDISSINGTIEWANSSNSVLAFIGSNYNVGDNFGNLEFATGGTSTRMVINSSGNVGIGISTPDASSILHLRSNSKGFLPPTMTTGERDSIGGPADGLIIYNTDTQTINVFTNSGGWKSLLYI